MNLAAIFAMLMQLGVCSASDFQRADGATLRVLVCPVTMQPADPPAPAGEDMSKPPGKGKMDG